METGGVALPLVERPSMSAMNISAIENMSGATFDVAAPLPAIHRSAVVAGDTDRREAEVEDTARRPRSNELSTESADDV